MACALGAMFLLCLVGEAAAKGKFIARQNASFSDSSGWWATEFEVTGSSTQFAFYFAADYQATAAIFSPSQLASFQNGGAFTALSLFDRKIGVEFPELSPGTYHIGVRNANNGRNTYSIELDNVGEYPPEIGATLAGTVITDTAQVGKNGGRAWVPFTLQSGFLHSVDGVNSGLESYLIPSSELSNFQSGRVFQYYESFSGTRASLPGYSELTLPPGSYYYAFYNPDEEEKSVVFSILKWSDPGSGGGGGGLELDRPVSWQVSGTQITLEAAAVVNRGNGTSGSLRLSVWFTSAPYVSGTLSGYRVGSYDFTSTLGSNRQFANISQSVSFARPPDGTYYSVMTLSEWDGSQFVIQDFETFEGTSQLGGGGGGGGVGGGPVPTPPSLTASDGTSEAYVDVRWGEVPGHKYNLYRATSPALSSATQVVSNWGTQGYFDFDAPPGVTVYYWITAVRESDGAQSGPRGPVAGKRAAETGGGGQFDATVPLVTDLTATQGNLISIDLEWTWAPNGHYHRVYRSTGNSFASASLIQDQWYIGEYLDTEMPLNVPVYYWIVVVRLSDNNYGSPSPVAMGHAGQITSADPYDDWIATQSVPAGQRGRGDDPDGDGRTNLAEMGLGRSAANADAGADIEIRDAGNSLELSYWVSAAQQAHFTYAVEASGNGGRTWSPAGLSASAGTTAGGRVHYSGTLAKGTSGSVFRLRMTER